MINLYTATSFTTESYRRVIFPLLFDIFFIPNEAIKEKYQMVDRLEDADIAVLPVDIAHLYETKQQQFVHDFIGEAKRHNKIIWVYSANDLGWTIDFDYDKLYTFRLGGEDSKMNNRNLVLPAFLTDPYTSRFVGEFIPLSKTEKPTIGFVGHASAGLKKYLSEYYIYAKYNLERFFKIIYSDYFSFSIAGIKRYHLLKRLQSSEKISANFILREKYGAGVKQPLDKEKTTREYFQNMFDNGYTFCFRGGGNFSVRLYETLAMGRIPVLVNTDCRLPLSNLINWENHCLIVGFGQRSALVDRLVHFHENLSENQFVEMQQNNRQLWKDCLKRESYFLKIHDSFIEKLQKNGG